MTAENLNHFTEEYKHVIQRGVNMKTKFFIDCRRYKTPCKTVLNADEFIVEFLTGEHSIEAKVSDKCYFLSIDNTRLSSIKCDFHFSRNYTSPKDFLSNLYDTFNSFLNTSIPFSERHFPHSTDDVIRRILELQEMKKEQFEIVTEPTTKTETTEETSDPDVGEFVYDVDIHHFYGWDTYTVRADDCESAKDKALKIMKNESLDEDYRSIDSIRIYKEDSDELLKEIIFEPSQAKDTTEKEQLADDQFYSFTKTLIKSLFKAIGLEETRKIPFIISNNMVFFNYNGVQYKYYPSQCKVFKKCGRKYQRINWNDFAEENIPDGQKQIRGRSPPFTPDIRSLTINDLK